MTVYAVVASDSNNTMDESVDIFEDEVDAMIWKLGRTVYDLFYCQNEKSDSKLMESIKSRMDNGNGYLSALEDEYEAVIGRHVWIYDKEVR